MRSSKEVRRNVEAHLVQIAEDANQLNLLWIDNCDTSLLPDHLAALRLELSQIQTAVLERCIDQCVLEADAGKPEKQIAARLKRLTEFSV